MGIGLRSGRHGENRTASASNHALRRAAAQSIEKIQVTTGCEHEEVCLPRLLRSQDFIENIALSDYRIIRRPGYWREFTHRHGC